MFKFYILDGNFGCPEKILVHFENPSEVYNQYSEIPGIYEAIPISGPNVTTNITGDNVWAKTNGSIYIWEGKNETNEAQYDRWIINGGYQADFKESGLRSVDKVSDVGCPDKVQSWEFYHDDKDDWVLAGHDVIVEELGTFYMAHP